VKYPHSYRHNIWLHLFPNKYADLAKQVPPSITSNESRQQYIRQLSVHSLANPTLLNLHLKTLTPLQQSIIQLHFFEQKACQQIAQQLQQPPSKIKKQLTAATILLRMKINPDYYAPLRQAMKSSTVRTKHS
jgi:DNA-directed RNA polymerase specialized sigma24 family protein